MENKVNILIISYFFAPDKRVGALRTSYWYKELESNYSCSVEVLTANSEAIGKGVHIVPSTGKSFKSFLIKDDGIVWKNNVINFLSKNSITVPNVVIISGSPFMHFSLSKDLKKRFGCKVILDYRDPFATNPGFKNSGFKVVIKKKFERMFNRMADGIITVNDYCGQIIEGFYDKPNAIVQNGYDESFHPDLKPINSLELSFSYAGKFYFSPKPILDALQKLNLPFHYAGPDENQLELASRSNVFSVGFVNYMESIEIIANHSVGIIQTYGEEFQSTTKIFDYIRCKRIILIISDNLLEKGSIHQELKGYPNVYWSKNDVESICQVIEKITSNPYIETSSDFHLKFSRKTQMLKLIDLIERIK